MKYLSIFNWLNKFLEKNHMSSLYLPSKKISRLILSKYFVVCVVLAFCAGIFSVFVGYLIQNNIEFLRDARISGFFVPDAVALKDLVLIYWETRPELDVTWIPIIGVMLLYVEGWFFGSLSVCFVNVILIVVATGYFFKLMEEFVNKKEYFLLIFVFVLVSVVGNGYLIEVMVFPNKEIPLLAITNAFVYYLLVRRNYFVATILSLVALAFRDGFGLILICCLLAVWFLLGRSVRVRVFLLLSVVMLLILFPVSELVGFGNIFERNINAAFEIDAGVNSNGYLGRLTYNVFSLGVLNSFITDHGYIDILSFGYWQFGVFVISGVFWAVKRILTAGGDAEVGISVVIIIAILCVSYGSYIQPRYMMPLFYFLAFGFVRCMRCAAGAILFSILIPVFLFLSGAAPVASEWVGDASWFW